jgi:alkaline phosphatase
MDQNANEVMSLTELAISKNMGAAVMSTESSKGATPASFSAHNISRDNSDDILDDQFILEYTYGVAFTCNFNQYTKIGIETIERRIMNTLDAIDDKDAGLFLMYEEAHIDKRSHDNDAETTYQSVIRFNQAIARFMEFAFYNPDTFILITADHETGILLPDENNVLKFNHDDHSAADVLVFTYGYGADIFNGVTIENIQIAHTIAALMGDENFGDQSVHKSLTTSK